MGRIKQVARKPEEHMRMLEDHNGHQFMSWWFSEDVSVPPISIQIYTTLSLVEVQQCKQTLHSFLSSVFIKAFETRLDIHSLDTGDVFECVNHQRYEIEYRRRLGEQTGRSTDRIPPILLEADKQDGTPMGYLVIVPASNFVTNPFVLGQARTQDGPVSVCFAANTNAASTTLTSDDETATLERVKITAQRWFLPNALWRQFEPFGDEDVDLHWHLGPAIHRTDNDILPDLTTVMILPDEVTISIKQDESSKLYSVAEQGIKPYQLQYIIYALAYDHNVQVDRATVLRYLLCSLVLQLLQQLPVDTSFHFEMHLRPDALQTTKPNGSNSLAPVLEHLRRWISAQKLDVGFLVTPIALENTPVEPIRRVPTRNSPAATLKARTFCDYQYFGVILDSTDFGQAGAILTMMAGPFDLRGSLGLPPSEFVTELNVERMPSWDYCIQRLAGIS